jgi:hypothetical protein
MSVPLAAPVPQNTVFAPRNLNSVIRKCH